MTELRNNSMEKGLDSEFVQQFVKENIIPARNGRRCVDGRYDLATEDSGTIARPGGDLGYAMIVLGLSQQFNLGLSPQQSFDSVYKIVTENGDKFYLHTDKHSDPEGAKHEAESKTTIGCGHAAKPMDADKAEAYDLNPEKMAELVSYAKEKAQNDPQVKMTNLNHEHQEKGVIIIKGRSKTINPQNISGIQYFVYDADRDEEFMQQLVQKLNLPNISYQQFKEMSDQQLTATLRNLALGKTIYQCNTDDPQLKIEQVGIVS